MTETLAQPVLNVELLNDVLDLIEKTPTKWEQSSWISVITISDEQKNLLDQEQYELCGTQACVAGWAMLLSHEWKPQLEKYDDTLWSVTGFLRASDGSSASEVAEENCQDEDSVYITEGMRLLGLADRDQAAHIFLYMAYSEHAPKTFTDNVRQYLGLPTKWGTTFDGDGYNLTWAEGEGPDEE